MSVLEVLIATATELKGDLAASRVLYHKSKDESISTEGRTILKNAALNQATHEALERWWEVPEPEDTL